TGTDLYVDLPRRKIVRRTLELADRAIVLQPAALRALPADLRRKAAVIRQSVIPGPKKRRRKHERFDVVVVAGLRAVKDPLRTAYAARTLPQHSRVRVTLVGPSLDPRYERMVRAEMQRNSRFRWVGPVSPQRARSYIREADLLVLSSR